MLVTFIRKPSQCMKFDFIDNFSPPLTPIEIYHGIAIVILYLLYLHETCHHRQWFFRNVVATVVLCLYDYDYLLKCCLLGAGEVVLGISIYISRCGQSDQISILTDILEHSFTASDRAFTLRA